MWKNLLRKKRSTVAHLKCSEEKMCQVLHSLKREMDFYEPIKAWFGLSKKEKVHIQLLKPDQKCLSVYCWLSNKKAADKAVPSHYGGNPIMTQICCNFHSNKNIELHTLFVIRAELFSIQLNFPILFYTVTLFSHFPLPHPSCVSGQPHSLCAYPSLCHLLLLRSCRLRTSSLTCSWRTCWRTSCLSVSWTIPILSSFSPFKRSKARPASRRIASLQTSMMVFHVICIVVMTFGVLLASSYGIRCM